MPGSSSFQHYCDQVCVHIRFAPNHETIRKELAGHLEDRADALALREPDLSHEELRARAVSAMGDPEEVGRALDAVHSPLLGWLQIWFRRLVWAFAILVGLSLIPQLDSTYHNFVQSLASANLDRFYENRQVVADYRPEVTLRTEDYTFSVPRVLLTKDEFFGQGLYCTIKVTNRNPWLRNPAFYLLVSAHDDLGGQYPSLLSWGTEYQTSSSVSTGLTLPFAAYFDSRVYGLGPQTKQLTLVIDRYDLNPLTLVIPLERGDGNVLETPH